MKVPDLNSSTEIENDEFYRILDNYNNVQIKAIEYLIKAWSMPKQITSTKWMDWSQSQYDKHSFKNESGIVIFPHGYGLQYKDKEIQIGFDLGDEGEIHGFDANRLWHFVESNKLKTLFTNMKQIEKVMESELSIGKLRFSGYINYYKL